MDLLPDTEQEEIVGAARSLLADRYPATSYAALDGADRVVDRTIWSECAAVGWFGLGVPESLGGVGYALPEEALLFVELGAAVAPGPHLATVLGAHLAATAGLDAAAQLMSGDQLAGWAEPTRDGRLVVHHPNEIDWIVVADESTIALWPRAAVDPQPFTAVDALTPLARADRPAGSPAASSDDPVWRQRIAVLSAALAAGIARFTAESSTEYAKDREQFGVPIGSFQAVKHRCADMAVRAESAIAQVRFASLSTRDDSPNAMFESGAARRVALSAAIANAEINVQNHGGIGFTWEHTAHRYVTRSRLLEHVGAVAAPDVLGSPISAAS